MRKREREDPRTLEARVRCPACGNVVGLMDSTPCARCAAPNLRVPRPAKTANWLSGGDVLPADPSRPVCDEYGVARVAFRPRSVHGSRLSREQVERMGETHSIHFRDPDAFYRLLGLLGGLDRIERRQMASLLLMVDVVGDALDERMGTAGGDFAPAPIPIANLVAGRWYWGGGRGGPCALWDGAKFLMPRVDGKARIRPEDRGRWEIEVTAGGYGAFVPYVDVGQVEYGECLRHDPVAREAEDIEHGVRRGRDAIYYVEREGAPVPASFEEWAAAHERGFPLVARTEVGDGVVVSTRFFGTRRGPQIPLAPYETMILGGECDLWSRWTATRAEAAAAHEDACGVARRGAR